MSEHDLPPPPRRLAVGDPNYRRCWGRLRIQLDGEEQQGVVAYDLQARTITRHARDEEGRKFLNRQTQKVATETVRGDVRVSWR